MGRVGSVKKWDMLMDKESPGQRNVGLATTIWGGGELKSWSFEKLKFWKHMGGTFLSVKSHKQNVLTKVQETDKHWYVLVKIQDQFYTGFKFPVRIGLETGVK